MVEKDQQENKESQEWLRRWTNTHQLTKLVGIWWKIDNGIDQIVVAGDNNLKRGEFTFTTTSGTSDTWEFQTLTQ